jgi:hypothetical protein
MLDRLSPAARSAVVLCLLAPLTALLGAVVAAVLAAGGVSGLDWAATGRAALDAGATALATGAATFATMYVSPLTARYGVGSRVPAVDVAERLRTDDEPTPLPEGGLTS